MHVYTFWNTCLNYIYSARNCSFSQPRHFWNGSAKHGLLCPLLSLWRVSSSKKFDVADAPQSGPKEGRSFKQVKTLTHSMVVYDFPGKGSKLIVKLWKWKVISCCVPIVEWCRVEYMSDKYQVSIFALGPEEEPIVTNGTNVWGHVDAKHHPVVSVPGVILLHKLDESRFGSMQVQLHMLLLKYIPPCPALYRKSTRTLW